MSREEAIKIFNTVLFLGKCDAPKEDIEEALTMAIQALEEQQNPNSIRINFVGEEEAKEFDEYLKNQQESVLDKIKAEIERQEKWLMTAGYNAYNVDIALDAIKSAVAESEDKE